MLTSKQRAQLRGMASTLQSILTVGKGGMSPALYKQAADALLKRELIKGNVLETCEYSAREAAEIIAAETGAEVVCAIGNRFVLYKRHPQKPVIELVGENSKKKR